MKTKPTQSQLMLPLLETIEEMGGSARPIQVYDRVAERLKISEEIRNETAPAGEIVLNTFERQVRWARQTAIGKGLLETPKRGIWSITKRGADALGNATPGLVVTVYETTHGKALWAMAEDAAGLIADESVDLLFTSPPYPLAQARSKTYGTVDSANWLDWMGGLAAEWKRILRPTASLMVNLGTVWQPGRPVADPYIERFVLKLIDDLGFHLADKLFWHNPLKLPSPMPWVAVRRVRVKQSIEPILWFAKNPDLCKADNRRVLQPYSEATLKRHIGRKADASERPSGYKFGENSFAKDNGGSIPSSLIIAPNTTEHNAYRKACRAADLPVHPATFPSALPEFAIKLTTVENDVVYDPFMGSGTTAAVAERLGRRWIGSERSLAYIKGSANRFDGIELDAA